MWNMSIAKVAEVTRTLSAVISELKSVPIGDTNILVTRGWRRGNTKRPNGRHKKARSETG